MRKLGPLACALACAALAACSSIIEGTSQEITVNTNPAGADCLLNRQGLAVAHVSPTPGAATIQKTKDDITIVCTKDGFETATYLNHSGAAGATFGNIILGGGIGWPIDSASGADNKYDSPANITLVPKVAAQGTSGTPDATQPPGPAEGAGPTTTTTQPPVSVEGAAGATAAPQPAGIVPAAGATPAASSPSPDSTSGPKL